MEASILVCMHYAFVAAPAEVVSRVLVTIDRFFSMGMGRPSALQSEEYAFISFLTLIY
jgi:hypothetical protein